jgi:hypothetical protein
MRNSIDGSAYIRSYSPLRHLPLVQELVEEVHSAPLRPLKPVLLLRIAGVTADRKAMVEPREVDVLPLHARLRQCLQRVLLQLLRIHRVVLRAQSLHRHLDGLNLRLLEQTGVSGGDGVDERGVGGELEAGPAAVAEADGGDFLVLRLEGLGVLLDLGPTDLLAITADEAHDVELLLLLGVGHGVRVYDFAAEAVAC